MRAPLSWIREFTPLPQDPVAIAEALDNLGLEVEALEAPGREIVGVLTAKILEVTEASERRQAQPGRGGDGVGHHDRGVRGAERRNRDGRAVRAVGRHVARWLHARAPQDPRRRVRRHALLAARARTRGRSWRHPRVGRGCRARRGRARCARSARCRVRPRHHAEPPRRDVDDRRGPRARGALRPAVDRAGARDRRGRSADGDRDHGADRCPGALRRASPPAASR